MSLKDFKEAIQDLTVCWQGEYFIRKEGFLVDHKFCH